MKIYKQITDIFVKIVSVILMCLIASLVGVMLYELSLRNFLNKSFRASTELCGFLFMWMAFLGVIVLYDQDRLITLDMLYVRATPKVQTTFWMINKIFSLGLGIIMIVAYQGMYKSTAPATFQPCSLCPKPGISCPWPSRAALSSLRPSTSLWIGL